MKILIAGDGKVGMTLAKKLLLEDNDVTLIDINQSVLDSTVERIDVMTLQGNAASMEVLKQAGVMNADLLIAVTSADEINLLCCMTAHILNKKLHTIARMRNPEYGDQIYEMRDVFGLSMTVNPERQAALEIERLLKYPGFLKRDTFAKGRVEIVELRIDEESKLCGVPLYDMGSIVKCKVLICAVSRDCEVFIPGGDYVFKQGDRIFVTAASDHLTTLLRNLGIVQHKVKNVLLCGGGGVSFYLAQQLEKSGINVQLIEQDEKRCIELACQLPQINVIHGDASNQFLLESEGINDCDALVTMTGLDEMNMIISLFGTRCKVPQIITKVDHTENNIQDSLPIGSVVCPKDLCCTNIVRYVRAMQNAVGAAITMHTIADGQAEAMEFMVDDNTQHCGEPLKNLPIRKNVLIACITSGRRTDIPNGDSTFRKGDRIIVVSSGDQVIKQLNDIFVG
ncbi:MAG: Trk system potassium transporter TrkA [Eubacteriales bacterium]|nr:Trk system potassium transporter TrkA [Eubacteriales bacterium]